MHADNALHLTLPGGVIRLCVILFVALVLLIFHAGVWGENKPAPHPTGIQLSSHTVMSDIFNSVKPRIKKQLRRLAAL
ncbi:hypothetical protein QZQ97_22590 [Serratia sp. root2]|uniref:hypothetical protein n=1 Tax=Serratia sp. root2 TaxID=3059676 RepID=UPI00288DBDBD|nr:hypothetical protein [Serratia sp. root2]MDT3253707.1 hypothetical protein [Serratia sp. root2]